MKCPIDGETLVMTDRQGVEIDYCPTCRGVWLDRGELDKIVERSAGSAHPRQGPAPGARRSYGEDDDDHRRRPHKRESFLSELFDF